MPQFLPPLITPKPPPWGLLGAHRGKQAIRGLLMGMAAMIFLTIVAAGAAHATRIGVVNFANGSTHPIKIAAGLVA